MANALRDKPPNFAKPATITPLIMSCGTISTKCAVNVPYSEIGSLRGVSVEF